MCTTMIIIMNEHRLMMGECTNGAKYHPDAVTEEEAEEQGRHMRIMYSSELSRIALERCRTARKAILLIRTSPIPPVSFPCR